MAPDSGLTELGWQQAHLVADWLSRSFTVDALVSSALVCARQTAEVIGQQLGLAVEIMSGFDETHLPYWNEFPTTPDDPLAWWDQPWRPDPEHAPLYTRFRQELRQAMAELLCRHLGQTVVVVSHGGTIGTIVRSLLGGHQTPIFTENGGVTHLVWQEGRWRLVSHNERAHLGDPALPAQLPWAEAEPARTIVEHFQRVAASSALAQTMPDEEQERALIAFVAPQATDRVLDVGAGAGAAALALAAHTTHVTAVDIAPAMLERAESARSLRGITNVDIRWADATSLPYPPASFDLILCRNLCCYIADLAQLFAELRRVIRPTGRLVIEGIVASEDPVKRATHQALAIQHDPAIVRLYSESEIEHPLREAGFRIERAEVHDAPTTLEEWLALSLLAEAERAGLREMVRASIEEDAAGLCIQRNRDGIIAFTFRRLQLLARLNVAAGHSQIASEEAS